MARLLDELEIVRAHVLGLSWGGMLAQELYRIEPARVRGLILADTYAGWKGSFSRDVAEQRFARCARESTLPPSEFVDIWVPEFFTEGAPPELFDEMSRIVGDFHPLGFRLMAKSLADTDTTSLLKEIAAPTLLVWGEGDIRSPLSVAHDFHERIRGSKLTILENAGHVSNMERARSTSRWSRVVVDISVPRLSGSSLA